MHARLLFADDAPKAATPVSGQVQIRHVRLHAKDLAAQAAFYRDALKLPVETGKGFVRVTAGTSIVEFVPVQGGGRPFYHFAFTIPENKLTDAMAWLEPRCPILNIRNTKEKIMDFKGWNAQSFYYNDPEGNILEFIVHHDLANGVSEPFGSQHVLWESEIGLVVPDVPAAEKAIADSLGLKYYRDHSPVFSPVGDVRGLLIVVKKDRVWLPTTDVHADVFPTAVELAGIEGHGHTYSSEPYTIRVA